MFNVKSFPNYRATQSATPQDRDFLQQLVKARDNTGAQIVNFAALDYSKENPDAVHFLTYPIEWIAHYVRHFYAGIDPLLAIDYRRVSHVDWRQAMHGEAEADILARMPEYGLGNNALTIAIGYSLSQYGISSFIFHCPPLEWESFKAANIDQLRFQADQLAEIHAEIFSGGTPEANPLTPRELDSLRLVAMGKTDEQIAEALGIGKWTVVSHLKSAKYKLRSPNRAAAVARAITDGIIELKKAG